MSDHPHDYDAFERSLLASAKGDAMSPARKRALAAALVGGATVATTTTAAAGAVGAGAAGAGAANVKAGIAVGFLKWVAVGVASSAVIAGGVNVASHRKYEQEVVAATSMRAPPASPVALATAPAASASPVASTTPVAAAPPAPETVLVAAPLTDPVPAPPSTHARAAARAPATASTPTLADELRLIERARACLAANDVACAERSLEAHARSFSSGVFAEEARVLRIDAMARRGERARAEAAARATLAANPDSPHAPRLRALLGER